MDICTYISLIINEIYGNLKANLSLKSNFCHLQNLSFVGHDIPDYKNTDIQYLYLLRYFPAYLFEYYSMYKKIFKYIPVTVTNCNILSVGCGASIDYIGARFALNDYNHTSKISYTGIDAIQWITLPYPIQYNTNDNHHINITPVENVPFFALNNNIIFFPKSIGEFTLIAWQQLKKALIDSNFNSAYLILAFSIRESCFDDDICRVNELVTLFTNSGYTSQKDISSPLDTMALKHYFPNFNYPAEVIDYISSLPTRCPKKLFFGKDDSCMSNCHIDRQPILTTNYIRYYITVLTKEV